jgi:predicted ArsR family transcriptional regulator
VKSVRELILDYLLKNHLASAAELSQMLHVTKADVRYHLKSLIEGGEIEKANFIQPKWKGRPTRLYQLADQARPGNYRHLADALLTISEASDLTLSVINQLAAFMVQRIPSAKHRATQLNRLVSFFTDNAYDAVWEAYANGPRIIFRSCPFSAILPSHPQLCILDGLVIDNYLNLHFSQVSRIDPGKGKVHACIFQIAQSPTPQ